MTPPSSSKVEALVAKYAEEWDSGCGPVSEYIRSAVLAALELAASSCECMYDDCPRTVRSLSIPSEKPREEPCQCTRCRNGMSGCLQAKEPQT